MKTFSRIIAMVMVVAMLVTVMAACGKKGSNLKDDRLYGSWKQTDEVDGNWTWTFNEDGTCTLRNDDTGAEDPGTYKNEGEEYGKLRIKLNSWEKELLFTYAVTEKVLDLEEMNYSFYLLKQ